MKIHFIFAFAFVILSSAAFGSELEITEIRPIFNKETPGFGKFAVTANIKNDTETSAKLVVSCFYIGHTRPGVYFKNEPIITKQYKIININAKEETQVVFDQDFLSYHPEALGEIIISISGKGVLKSIPLKTSFHPKSEG